jgi:hypothetical protein
VVAELVLRWDGGELDLNGPAEDSAFTIEMSENGADWGNPEAVRQQVTRALLNAVRRPSLSDTTTA